MEHLTPDQRSVTDQLHDLRHIANERGMYDAADWLERKLRELEGLRPHGRQEILKTVGSTAPHVLSCSLPTTTEEPRQMFTHPTITKQTAQADLPVPSGCERLNSHGRPAA